MHRVWTHTPTLPVLSTDIQLSPQECRTYQRAVGRLMYLMLVTRQPGIAYAVTKLAHFSSSPSRRH